MLTVVIVDDIVALAVIATVGEALNLVPLLVAVACFAGVVAARRLRIRRGPVCFALGLAAWGALLESGVEPIVIGLALGLLAYAYPAPREARSARPSGFGVPRAADCGDRPARGRRAPLGDVHQRAAPAALPSLDELRRRAAVRPRQRRRLDRSSLSRACGHIADRARRLRRLRRRQAPGDLRRVMAADAAVSRRRLSRPSGGPRSPVRARSQASDSPWRCSSRRWPSTGRGSRRRSSGSSARGQRRHHRVLFRATALLRGGCESGAAGDGPAARRPLHRRRSRARSHPRPGRRAGHGGRVRGLRVSLLRDGRAGRARAAQRLRGCAVRLAEPSAQRRPWSRTARG